MLLLRFPNSPHQQPQIILYIQGATHLFYPLVFTPHSSREREQAWAWGATIRQQTQHEVKVNKHNLKHVFCAPQDKFVFDLTLPPPFMALSSSHGLLLWSLSTYQLRNVPLPGTVIQFLHPSAALCDHSLRLLVLNLHPFILSNETETDEGNAWFWLLCSQKRLYLNWALNIAVLHTTLCLLLIEVCKYRIEKDTYLCDLIIWIILTVKSSVWSTIRQI